LENLVNLENTFDDTFRGKTVFVTGHTGFIGTWLSLWLHSLGAKVIGYSINIPTKPSLFEILDLRKDITHIIGDVNDPKQLIDCLTKYQPEIVFHLAAQSIVKTSYDIPIETFQTNVMGTANVLESIRKVPSVRVCVIITSDKCYENRELDYAYKEGDPMGGSDPYSASKGSAELIVASYRKSFFDSKNNNNDNVCISSVRAGNVLGGGDWAKYRIVPDCFQSLKNNQPIPVRHPNSTRPWQYVLEPISGMLRLATKMWHNPVDYGSAWNFGPVNPKNKILVKEIVSQILEEWGDGKWVNVSQQIPNEKFEAGTLMLDSTKAKESLQWKPVYSLKESISETIQWYRSYENKTTDMKNLTLKQIQKYGQKAKQLDIPWATVSS